MMQRTGKHHKFYQMQMDLNRINLMEVKRFPSLIIRKFRQSDAPQLVRVFNEVFSGTSDPFPSITQKDLENLPANRIILAELAGQIVGFLMCGTREIEGERIGIIGYVGVLKEHRRKGIATCLAIEAGKFFLRSRMKKIIAEVYYLNRDSYNFIKGFGFKQVATIYVPIEEATSPLFRIKPS